MNEEIQTEHDKAMEQYKEWHISKQFEVLDTTFELAPLNHAFRLKVLPIFTEIEAPMLMGNYNFLENAKFKALFKEIENYILLDGMQISKIEKFWEENEYLYLDFIAIVFRLITFPFFYKKKVTSLTEK